MQLTPHFSIEELIASESAARAGIDNSPPKSLMPSLLIVAQGLEAVRSLLGGRSIHVTSGFRCPKLNALVGGAPNSAHMKGLAADIICPEFGTPLQICQAVAASGVAFNQVIHEFGHWCHVEFCIPPNQGTRQLLTITSAATGYVPGLH